MEKNISELIEKLKLLITESEVLKEYTAARDEYSADKALSQMTSEYNAQLFILENESKGGEDEKDDLLISSVKARLDKLYGEISSSELTRRLIQAEDELNLFYNTIFNELKSVAYPEEPDGGGCAGDCSACGGCHF